MRKIEYNNINPYITKDGSVIRELIHPKRVKTNISFAEATIPLRFTTFLHKHIKSEEIYYVIEGEGIMVLGNDTFHIKPSDTIYIPPNTPHQVKNTGEIPLKIFCICSPPYSHNDTEILSIEE